MTRYRTQSRLKPLHEFLSSPGLHLALAIIVALAVVSWLEVAP